MKTMKLLITGASGFIGSYAVKAAMARGWEVDSIDTNAESERRRVDVRLLQRIEADCVLHLAAWSSNAEFDLTPKWLAEHYANNVFGLWNVLRLAQQCGARVVYASSSAVYGNQRYGDLRISFLDSEDDFIDQEVTRSHYARSKIINELMSASYPNTLGLRIFNAYGSGDERKRFGSPITQMLAAKAKGEPFVCYGDGTQAKDFIHVSDVVEIIMRLIESPATGIVNVGTGVATSFSKLLELVGNYDACGDNEGVQYAPVPDPASYQYFTRADLTRLHGIIGDYKCLSVEEGLKLL